MMMSKKNVPQRSRTRSISLVLIMLLSIIASANLVDASIARTYTTNRDPVDIALGDFDCDQDLDMALATAGTHTMSILWNNNGDFTERSDIWVAGNTDELAEWEDFANVLMIETGDINGDGAEDIILFQRNNPFKTDDQGAPAGEPGNVTVLQNNGCSGGFSGFTISARYSHFWAWDLAVDDLDGDGNDDIVVMDLLADITSQRLVTYRGPISSSTQPLITSLGPSSTARFSEVELGDYGESQTGGTSGTCTDLDAWLLVGRGVDYSTGQYTTQGHDDNMSVMEFSCLTNTFPATATTATMNGPWQMNVEWGGFDIADMDGDGRIDMMAMTDGNVENVSYRSSSVMGTWSTATKAYFGPYIAYTVTIDDLNGDGDPDFINPTIAEQINSTSSTGSVQGNYYLTPPSTVQVTLSDGNGGYLNPLSYNTGRRPIVSVVGQLVGSSSSPLDIVVGHDSFDFGSWVDNSGWDGQYDSIIVIEMDNKDLEVSSIEISPTDRYIGAVGEGSRSVNVTVTNTGMNVLNGQATLDVELKTVDESASTNQTVYAYDWDSPESASGCGGGCTWSFDDYLGNGNAWHEETNHSNAAPSQNGNNDVNVTANWTGNNPTDFMWAGTMETNSTGSTWSGYHRNWDEGMTLNDVDLTGSDRAWLSVELFQHLGFGALGGVNSNGQWLLGDLWDDVAMIEVRSDDRGWSTINCPTSAWIEGACISGESIWGGYDMDRYYKMYQLGGYAESNMYYGIYSPGTYYGWNNFTEEGVGAFDLSPWAGDTVDIRFRFRTGFEGSISDANETRWSGRDGYAVDNVTIWKQNTAFSGSPQTQQSQINMVNLQPGEEYETSIQANFDNDTVYRISATLNYGQDEQPANDELTGYIQTLNIFDPAMVEINSFDPGALYAEGALDIDATVAHYGNTEVDFDVEATVLSATPNDVDCGSTTAVCDEGFEGGANGYRYADDDGDGNGAIQIDSGLQEVLFGSNAYWFGHPDVSANSGYEDVWNESFTLPNIDLTNMQGDFASLSFDYFAETFYYIDTDGDKYSVNDYVSIQLDWDHAGTPGSGMMIGQWNDYNEDGTCIVDEDGDGFIDPINETTIDNKEVNYIGDAANIDGTTGGNYNVFFDTEGLVMSRSIDLTHLFILNQTTSGSWRNECMSLKGTSLDLSFEFQSDDDGHNGLSDGLRGVAFDNITIEEFTFVQDAVYSSSVSGIDAEEEQTLTVGTHDFSAGVYMIQVESIFDNTTQGTSWYGEDEFNEANNIERVIFTVESVNITLGKPNSLACLNDVTLPCTLPIDSALTHDYEFSATNGVLAGEYRFNMHVTEMGSGNEVYSTQANGGSLTSLDSHERTTVAFTGWSGWQDGLTYNISFDAELADGSPSGNIRYFHATFANSIDIAILSDPTNQGRLDNVKRDLAGMGMSYTTYTTSDWSTYFDSGWLTHYEKILIPWQSSVSAMDVSAGGKGFYKLLGESANQQTLENFMSAGGTVQMHLGAYENYYQPDRLPFQVDISNRVNADEQVTYNDLNFDDPYHPLFDNVNLENFNGFEVDHTVTQAVIDTNKVGTQEVPKICGDTMLKGGQFQSLMSDETDSTKSLLAVCGYQQGGLILTTIDVEFYSDPFNSTTMPLLGNMLAYKVSPYPVNFGAAGNGFDITINGEVPDENDGTTSDHYAIRFMKSSSTLNFGFAADGVSAQLDADWILDGPTNWDGTQQSSDPDHTDIQTPSASFCNPDPDPNNDCLQGSAAAWTLTLFLHDQWGHARVVSINLTTSDVNADESRPEANATVIEDQSYADQLSLRGTKTVGGKEWNIYEVQLGETGDVDIQFDASNSFDPDALEGNGIKTYQWTVFFDYPFGDDPDTLEGHSFSELGVLGGAWTYRFKNSTVDEGGFAENQIRIELIVYDQAGKTSEKYRLYFVVVPEGYGDDAPVVTIDPTLNNSRVDSEWIFIAGQVQSGAEESDVKIEIALDSESLNTTPNNKLKMKDEDGAWNQTAPPAGSGQIGLGDGDSFSIGLKIDDLFSNISRTQTIYIKVIEGDGSKWTIYKYVEIEMPACKGVEVPTEALQAGGQWELDASNQCVWEGSWTYNPDTGVWTEPSTSSATDENSGDNTLLYLIGGGGLLLVIIVILSMMVLRRGGDEDAGDGFGTMDAGYGGVAQMDPMEAYVQQLIAQGYPEQTARAYAQQYAGHFQQQQQQPQ